MNEQTTYNKEYKKPISDPTDRKQNFINFQAKQIEKLIKENRRLIQLQKRIEGQVEAANLIIDELAAKNSSA